MLVQSKEYKLFQTFSATFSTDGSFVNEFDFRVTYEFDFRVT